MVASRFKESKDQQGNKSSPTGTDPFDTIANMPVVDVVTGRTVTLREVANLSS
jgi:hypothetical protein